MTVPGSVRGREEKDPQVGPATILNKMGDSRRDLDRFTGSCQKCAFRRSDRQFAGEHIEDLVCDLMEVRDLGATWGYPFLTERQTLPFDQPPAIALFAPRVVVCGGGAYRPGHSSTP